MKRRAILQCVYGANAGRKVVLEPGEVLRVGRSDEADVVVPGDRRLAPVHFEIDWDGSRCEARSRLGRDTTVDGRAIERAVVPDGSFLRAGDTFFQLFHEAAPPELGLGDPGLDEVSKSLRSVPNLWGVFDAARDEGVLRALRECVDPARSLYEGVRGDALSDAAPWLVRFRDDSMLLERLVREGWGEGWGIYLDFPGTEKELRRHLRRLLVVEEEDTRRKLYLRFYDPRVLRDFVPTCSARQLDLVFGDIESFHIEGEHAELLRFGREHIPELAAEEL